MSVSIRKCGCVGRDGSGKKLYEYTDGPKARCEHEISSLMLFGTQIAGQMMNVCFYVQLYELYLHTIQNLPSTMLDVILCQI